MTLPFTREDAKRRAGYARNTAETWKLVVTERGALAATYKGAERAAALGCLAVARVEVAHHLAQAEAYERIARGEDPYP